MNNQKEKMQCAIDALRKDPILDIFNKMQTPLCISNIYPPQLIWCNPAWLRLWEGDSLSTLQQRDEAAQAEWGDKTHDCINELHGRIQIDKRQEWRCFTIFPHGTRKRQINLICNI